MKNNNTNNNNKEVTKELKLNNQIKDISNLTIIKPNQIYKKNIKNDNECEKQINKEKSVKNKKFNKNGIIKLPPLSHNIQNVLKNKTPNDIIKKTINNKENEKISFNIKTKIVNKKGKSIDIKSKHKIKHGSKKTKLKKISFIEKEKGNKLLPIGEEAGFEDDIKKYENFEENNFENFNNDDKIIINNENNVQGQINNKFAVFHFYESNNLYIFIKNSKIEELFQQNVNLKNNNNYEIIEDISLPPAYKPRINKYGGMPKCIIDTCSKGNISLIKNEDNCNIIWKLLPPGKMRDLIRKLGKNQKFNHFPSTYQIGLKDNMYKHYKIYKRLFPKLYNFTPDTYILPNDAEIFENIYKKNKKTLWIVKPVNMSRGRGVHLLKDENELKELIKKSYEENAIPDLLSRYLDKPHLINNKKYDLRIYVLVTSFSPLRFYIYYNGLVRFATEDYKKGNYDNIYIHITNYSINKNNLNYKSNQKNNKEIEEEEENEEEDDSSKWSLVEYRNYFKKLGLTDTMNDIWKQIEDIIIKSLITVANDNSKEISVSKTSSLFELYGYDILIDESFKAWLIEVNVNPSLHCTSPLDLSIKTDLVTDIFNIVGILPYNHNYGEPIYNYEMMKKKIEKKEKEKEMNGIKKEKNKKIKLPQLYNGNNNKVNDKNLMNLRMAVVQNFNIDNLQNRIPEYDNEYYKKMIEVYNEEKQRALISGFTMIFPKKENIDFYSKILAKENKINDTNIVLWEYILNNE